VKLACELPDKADRSLSLWTCGQLAIKLTADGTVDSISAQSVQRILDSSKLKPWRVHYWLSPKVTRDEAFRERVLDIMGLYTRELGDDEVAYSLDEKTSLQPRTRSHETKPPRAGNQPALLEHEYARKGALQLFAAFNLRSGEVVGVLRHRKRQVEFLELLEAINSKHPASIRVIHLVCDNVSVHARQVGPSVASSSSTLPDAFHAGALFVDEPSRAVVLDPAAPTPDCAQLRRPSGPRAQDP
jgi:hypothetical protein